MMANTTINSRIVVQTNIMAEGTSSLNAIIMAPNTTKGERSSSLRVRFSPCCTWFISLVMRVMRVEVPMSSSSVWESLPICSKRAWRRAVTKPTDAFAAKYWAVTEHTSPMNASPNSSSVCVNM